jgi:5-formyltetrahydrofolate cyclo-ligase
MQPAEKSELRRQLKQARKATCAQQRTLDAEYAASTLLSLCQTHQISCVALYFATEFEFDTASACQQLWKHGIQVVMPKLHPFCKGHLLFQTFLSTTPMTANRFYIPEPKLNACDVVPVQSIDAFVLPLVGFDSKGHRLGMGGGYYDRTLANVNPWGRIGFGFDVQQVAALKPEPWDVQFTHVITGSRMLRIAQRSKS